MPDLRASVENTLSHRVLVGRAEIGAAWSKFSHEGRGYLGRKFGDPSFNAPICAKLFDDEDGEDYSLAWSRPDGVGSNKKQSKVLATGPGHLISRIKCTHPA